jgi:hypothetical protein
MPTVSERKREFVIDIIARMAQIVFAVLIVGPFVNNLGAWYFVFGITAFFLLMIFGLALAAGSKEV